MKTKKQYLIDLINENVNKINVNKEHLFYIILNKDNKTNFMYNENTTIQIVIENSNKEYLMRIFNELNYRNFTLSFSEFLKITEKYIGKNNMNNIMKNELFNIDKVNPSRYSIDNEESTDFFVFERYFKKYIKENLPKINVNDYNNELKKVLKDLSIQEQSNYINYLIKRVTENGTITFHTTIFKDNENNVIKFSQIYSYKIENGDIVTNEVREVLENFKLEDINDDLTLKMDNIDNSRKYREYVIYSKNLNFILNLLSKDLLRIKLLDKLPEKNFKIKGKKI